MKNKHCFNRKLALTAQAACILEADAPKVGNVNRLYDFADAGLEDFHLSALAIGDPFGRLETAGVGKTVFEAVKATRKVAATNTNLGMILLLAPLGMAWSRMQASVRDLGVLKTDSTCTISGLKSECAVSGFDSECVAIGVDSEFGAPGADGAHDVTGDSMTWEQRVRRERTAGWKQAAEVNQADCWKQVVKEVLAGLNTADTAYVYQAIKMASPSGMGEVSEYDVLKADAPPIPLVDAMRPAAKRDLIARQYCEDFNLVLGPGRNALNLALAQGLSLLLAIAQTHLFLLGAVQDTLITRKLGIEWSAEVQKRAEAVYRAGGWLSAEGREQVRELDRFLRQDGHKRNPGSTADLTAAILFIHLLETTA